MAYKVTRNVTIRKSYPARNVTVFSDYIASEQSPKGPNGKLILRSNPMIARRMAELSRQDYYRPSQASYISCPSIDGQPNLYGPNETAASDKAWARFRNQLHRGDSSLGVTLGSAGQTMKMISGKLEGIAKILKGVKSARDYRLMRSQLTRDFNRSKTVSGSTKAAANRFLEVEFGWLPLYSDAVSAMEVLCGDLPPRFVTARASNLDIVSSSVLELGGTLRTNSLQEWLSVVSLSCKVEVTNPNLWLLNRLGLVNPAVVAWDLVPWSFVVNMFVNVNEVLRSYTDYVGLALSDLCTTYTHTCVGSEEKILNSPGTNEFGYASSFYTKKLKDRILGGSPPRPSFRLKLPNVNTELALIGAALVRQQGSRIQGIVGINN